MAIRHIISAIAGAIIGIALAVYGYGVGAVAQMLGARWSVSSCCGALASWRPRFAFSMRHFRDLVGFGTSVFIHELVWTLAYQIDRLLLGRSAGAGPVGVYTVAQRLARSSARFWWSACKGSWCRFRPRAA